MFAGCTNLEFLNFPMETNASTHMRNAFTNCTKLKHLNIPRLIIGTVDEYELMELFFGVPENVEIITNPETKAWIQVHTDIELW